MPKNTSTATDTSPASAERKLKAAERKAARCEDARAEADRLRAAAEADAIKARADAEERARRMVLDARATADGVRAEGMELVSNLREMGDVLRANAERLLHDIQSIHSRMVSDAWSGWTLVVGAADGMGRVALRPRLPPRPGATSSRCRTSFRAGSPRSPPGKGRQTQARPVRGRGIARARVRSRPLRVQSRRAWWQPDRAS